MSQSSRPPRAKKVKSEDAMIRDILKIQKQLLTQHKTPSLFTFPSKYGQLQFGSLHAVAKFISDFAADGNWGKAFDNDDNELVSGDQIHELDQGEDNLCQARSSVLPRKLSVPVSLMNYTELWAWINEEILTEYWAKGGKLKCIKFGNCDFEPSFWLNEIWDWKDVKKHPKDLTKTISVVLEMLLNS